MEFGNQVYSIHESLDAREVEVKSLYLRLVNLNGIGFRCDGSKITLLMLSV